MNERNHERTFDRVGVRTSATLVTQTPPKTYKAWTDDLSPAGARILCEEEVPGDALLLRVLLPDLNDQFFECTKVRSDVEMIAPMKGRSKTLHAYGVEFTGVRSIDDVQAMIESAK